MDIIIFVVTHKYFTKPKDEIYKTIVVGSVDLKIENIYRDNTGVNIAHKNKNFCELTALYWIWKNVYGKDSIIGICHYRRFFSNSKYRKSSRYFLGKQDLKKILNKYDIILPEKNRWSITVGENYGYDIGKKKDLLLIREIIIKEFPKYLKDFERVVNAKSASYRNMFITRKELLDEYCEWLFAVLGEAEKDISLEGYTDEEARVYGYLSEILLNVWVLHKNLKVKYMPIILTEVSNLKIIKMRLRNIPVINDVLKFFNI